MKSVFVVSIVLALASPAAHATCLNALSLSVFLEGPYLGNGLMTSNRTFACGSGPSQYLEEAVTPLSVELLDEGTGCPVTRTAGWLLEDGTVVGEDCDPWLDFDVKPASYLVVVKQYNHVDVMSAFPVDIDDGGYAWLDLSLRENLYQADLGAVLVDEDLDLWGMFTGDGVANEQIQWDDYLLYYQQVGLAGFPQADYNLDGQVNRSDREWPRLNLGRGSQVLVCR